MLTRRAMLSSLSLINIQDYDIISHFYILDSQNYSISIILLTAFDNLLWHGLEPPWCVWFNLMLCQSRGSRDLLKYYECLIFMEGEKKKRDSCPTCI